MTGGVGAVTTTVGIGEATAARTGDWATGAAAGLEIVVDTGDLTIGVGNGDDLIIGTDTGSGTGWAGAGGASQRTAAASTGAFFSGRFLGRV